MAAENIIDSRTLEIRPEINDTIEKRKLINNNLVLQTNFRKSPKLSQQREGESDMANVMFQDKSQT